MNKFGRSLPSTSTHKKLVQTPNLISITQDGGYNIKEHRLVNVKSPVDDTDAVNKKYLDDTTTSVTQSFNKKITETYQKYIEFKNLLDSLSHSLTTKIENLTTNCEKSIILLNNEVQHSKQAILNDLKPKFNELEKNIAGNSNSVKQFKKDLENTTKDIADVDKLINKHFSDFEVFLKEVHRVDVDEINKKIEAINQEIKSLKTIVYSKKL